MVFFATTFAYGQSTPPKITGWKKYTNKNLGFSMQIPKNWDYIEEFPDDSGTDILFGMEQRAAMGDPSIWGMRYYKLPGTSINKIIDTLGNQFKKRNVTKKKIKVGSLPAEYIVVTTPEAPGWYFENVLIKDGNRIFGIGNGAVKMAEFKTFYKSFNLLPKQKNKQIVSKKSEKGDCKPSGCNGEICSDTSFFSACWFLPEFACYKKAACVRKKNGQCGWVQTSALKKCIASKRKADASKKSVFIPNKALPMKISSPAFQHNGSIPSKYTCDGQNTNPTLDFADIPAGAKSLVLLMDDPDVPKSIRPDGMWDHWVVWNMPPTTVSITEGETPTGAVGKNTGGSQLYGGPCPPDREHRYFFKLYALDALLDLPEGSSKAVVEKAMKGHVLAQAELVGRYNRQ